MVIYIHGFGSSGYGGKSSLFRKHYKDLGIKFIAPSLSYIPDLAITTLEELIESYDEEVSLIGSSLGGFYSIYLAEKYNLKAVLINPSIHPYETLQPYINKTKSYFDLSSYEWNKTHIEMLKKYVCDNIDNSKFMLLLQKGDESLDYKVAIDKVPNAKQVVEDGGTHSFENVEKHFGEIKNFFNLETKV